MPVFSWRTKKTARGFEFHVSVFDETGTVLLQRGVERTRARAAGKAKKWMRYLNAQQRRIA